MAGSAAAEGAQPAQPQSVFGETIDVRVVNVEVVVTDKDGVRVTGLKPADFRLLVEGKEVPIDYFTEVRGGDAVAATAGEEAAIPGLPALAPGERVGHQLSGLHRRLLLARPRPRRGAHGDGATTCRCWGPTTAWRWSPSTASSSPC